MAFQSLSGGEPGHSPKRSIRLPQALNERVDEIAAAQDRTPTDVMRDAIAAYVNELERTAC